MPLILLSFFTTSKKFFLVFHTVIEFFWTISYATCLSIPFFSISSSNKACENTNPFNKFKFFFIFSGYIFKFEIKLVNLVRAKLSTIVTSGAKILSTDECDISLSCQSAIFSSIGTTEDLIYLERPVKFSDRTGFFL